MKNKKKYQIGVIGLWHLGCVYATGLARMGYEVEGYDPDKKIIKDLKMGKPPIFEPEMEETIKTNLGKALDFTESAKEFFKNKKYIFIAYDLPVNDKDIVNTKKLDLTTKLIKKYGEIGTTYVISSQAPLGTCRKIKSEIGDKGEMIYWPENIRLGKAYEAFLTPERIILGGERIEIINEFINYFDKFNCPFLKMSWESAEMVKHALNTYLATCVSYSSEIADFCEILGADMRDVVTALKTDRRVSQYAPISPGLGFAGATLGRDIQTLNRLGKQNDYKSKLAKVVYEINQDRLPWLMKKIKKLNKKLKGLNVGILGLTYKPGTNTLRRSMSLELAKLMHKEGANIKAFDPVITGQVDGFGYMKIEKNYEDFFKDLDMAILMTEWPDFKEVKLIGAVGLMKNKVILDTKNFLDQNLFVNKGFKYVGTGY